MKEKESKRFKHISPEKLLDEIVRFYFPSEEVLKNYRPDWMRNPKTGKKLEFDVYVPAKNIAFEMQGLHHKTLYQKERDDIKRKTCADRGIEMIEIWDIRDLISLMQYLAKMTNVPEPKWTSKKKARIEANPQMDLMIKVWNCFRFYERVRAGTGGNKEHRRNLSTYFGRINYIIRMDKGITAQKEETEGIRKRREAKLQRVQGI